MGKQWKQCQTLFWGAPKSLQMMIATMKLKDASSLKVKGESEKAGIKLNIQKMKIIASGPITSWQIDGETMETVSDFIFRGSKITAGGTAATKLKDSYSLEGKL